MNQRMFTIILALLLIAGFFLPILSSGSTNGLDMMRYPVNSNDPEELFKKYMWLVFPICGLMLLIGALNKGYYLGGRMIWAILPMLVVLYIIIRPVTQGFDISTIPQQAAIGFWVLVGASVILALYHPKR